MYESTTGLVQQALEQTASPVFTPEIISLILNLGSSAGSGTIQLDQQTVPAGSSGFTPTVAAGTDILYLQTSHSGSVDVTVPSGLSVMVFQGDGGVHVTVPSGSGAGTANDFKPDVVIIGSSGNDHIVVSGGAEAQVVLGTGNSTVVGGTGNETVVAGLGNATIASGGGHDLVQMVKDVQDYTVTITGGTTKSGDGLAPQAATFPHLVIKDTSTGMLTDITGVQYVQAGSDAFIFAANSNEAATAALYHTAFGRTGEFGGISYWFDMAKAGATLSDIAHGFANSAEFKSTLGAMTDVNFIETLYQHTFSRGADAGGLAYWQDKLAHGESRADVMASFAHVAALNEAGSLQTEATIVGHVMIVPDII